MRGRLWRSAAAVLVLSMLLGGCSSRQVTLTDPEWLFRSPS
jgi:major membrane immunogen (membrane-anchored lipoprotein)